MKTILVEDPMSESGYKEMVFDLPLNRASGNMYKWVSHTWNPVKGICPHGCQYCNMNNLLLDKYKPILVDDEFRRNLDEAKVLFVGDSIDLFSEAVPMGWIMKVLDHCTMFNDERPEKGHISFLFMSKNPAGMLKYAAHRVFKHAIAATTIESNRHYPEYMGNTHKPEERVEPMAKMSEMGIYTMVSLEPLMDFDLEELVDLIKRCEPKRVVIGKNSNRQISVPEPPAEKVKLLCAELGKFTKVFVRENTREWYDKNIATIS